ncbi:hypothetical protein [Paraburkholderia bryophila]|uniref:hypothetical protein n=1 Tax=Paraburkholderia bryophila TaxID=420952 RepID=UPI00142E4F68|nr:hypothetical protein [Paraburkholderia bryophila]
MRNKKRWLLRFFLSGFLIGYLSLSTSLIIVVLLWLAVSQSTLIARPADDRASESSGATARRAGNTVLSVEAEYCCAA